MKDEVIPATPAVVAEAGATQPLPTLSRIPALDGLRGIAAIVVITIHCFFAVSSDMSNVLDRTANLAMRVVGPSAVDLFFVLSGYLITSILDRTRSSTRPFSAFYARRFLRIVPLYAMYVLLIPVLFPVKELTGTPETRIWDWLFLTNIVMTQLVPEQIGVLFGHLWSLAIEEQFYILWPIVILLLPPRRAISACGIFIVMSFGLRVAFAAAGLSHYGWLLMPSRLDALAAGAVVALSQRYHPDVLERWTDRLIWPAGAAALVLAFALVFSFWGSQSPLIETFQTRFAGRRWEIVLSPLAGALFYASLVSRVSGSSEGARFSLLKGRRLGLIGQSSYGMYLFHLAIVAYAIKFGVPQRPSLPGPDITYQLAFALMIIGASHAFGLLSWHLYEKQWLKLAPRYHFRSQPEREPVVARDGLPSPVLPAP